MPRVHTTSVRRTKREAQPRLSRGGRSVSSAAATGDSISAPLVQLEPGLSRNISLTLTRSPRNWRNPDELAYIRTGGGIWNDMAIIRFLVRGVVSIPPRSPSTTEPWVLVRCADGSEVTLPRAYRLPLLWVLKYQWTSLELVLTAHSAIRTREWDGAKFEILHIARLCAGLLDAARAAMDGGGIDRNWRCALFDRALRRYWYGWLISRDEFVRAFWREFGEEEYAGDVLKLGWGQWVLKDHKGFTLTKQEVANGISAAEFTEGFVVYDDAGTFEWIEVMPDPPESPPTAQAELPAAEKEPTRPTELSQQPTPPRDNVSPAPPPSAAQNSSALNLAPRADAPMAVDLAPHATLAVASWLPFGPVRMPLGSSTPPESADVEMRSESAAPRKTPPASAEDAVKTRMGSRAPGCAPFRGHPTDVFRKLLEGRRAGSSEQDKEKDAAKEHGEETRREKDGENKMHEEEAEKESEEEEDDDEMEDIVVAPDPATIRDTPFSVDPPDVLDNDLDLDLDSDLQLMYPSSPLIARPSSSRGIEVPSPSKSRSPSSSPSRSVSPTPPLSTARFPASFPPPDTAHLFAGDQSRQLVRSPRRPLVDLPAEPGILARVMQEWGEDMRVLRMEVGTLRSELHASRHLERRIEVLEAHGPTAPQAVHTSAWPHPLGHLISGDEMDVDVGAAAVDSGTVMTKYAPAEGEPLPPRSRKFTSASPFATS
ncbi:hypothetical protein DFH09DRAFT_1155623 [Mycena vulgaris]|nr:hypothetical protein DFH09DRAFT_1155623 [Mycena vulgaris]